MISEYGYCACTPERPEGDTRRIEVLREDNRVFREKEYIGGLIFFCYNDYRTHIIPLERYAAPLPRMAPGDEARMSIQWREEEPVRIEFDVQRPTGFSVFSKIWKP